MKLEISTGRTVIKPLKTVQVTRVRTELDEEKNKGKNPATDTMETKEIKIRVPANYQRGEVIFSSNPKYLPGDIIIYMNKGPISFDLIKNTVVVDDYTILGKETEE